MQKLQHNGEKQQRRIKRELRKYLKSEFFQKAFERMVSRTIENGTEHGFGVVLQFASGQPIFGVKFFRGGGSPDSLADAHDLYDFYSSEFHDSDAQDFKVSTGNKSDDEGPEGLTAVIRLHTHPFITEMRSLEPDSRGGLENTWLETAAEKLLDDPSIHVPSPDDVKALIDLPAGFGMLVPVDIFSKKIEILVFQNVTPLSHVAYENIWEEAGTLDGDFDRVLLRLATERSILRVLELRKRKKAIITPADVDLILKTMELKNLKPISEL